MRRPSIGSRYLSHRAAKVAHRLGGGVAPAVLPNYRADAWWAPCEIATRSKLLAMKSSGSVSMPRFARQDS